MHGQIDRRVIQCHWSLEMTIDDVEEGGPRQDVAAGGGERIESRVTLFALVTKRDVLQDAMIHEP